MQCKYYFHFGIFYLVATILLQLVKIGVDPKLMITILFIAFGMAAVNLRCHYLGGSLKLWSFVLDPFWRVQYPYCSTFLLRLRKFTRMLIELTSFKGRKFENTYLPPWSKFMPKWSNERYMIVLNSQISHCETIFSARLGKVLKN